MSTQSEYDKIRQKEKDAANARAKKAAFDKVTNELIKLNNNIARLNIQIKEFNNRAKNEYKTKNAYKLDYVNYYNTAKANGVLDTPGVQAGLALRLGYISQSQSKIDAFKKQAKDAEDKKKKAVSRINEISRITFAPPAKTGGAGITGQGDKLTGNDLPKGLTDASFEFTNDWKYNAPMVSSAYFGAGPQANAIDSQSIFTSDIEQIIPGSSINVPLFTDAKNAWKGVEGGKGVMQMDRKFVNGFAQQISAGTGSKNIPYDKQMYGFKFLYNPTTVSMAWDVVTQIDPYYASSGEDAFNLISTGLLSSVLEFEVYLNRIGDFQQIVKGGGFTGDNPYPIIVPTEDIAEIYEKGTMYDLEYLFKTINGPNATFVSALNGSTADRGWLRPTFVELHLGRSMRYRVRISEFSVNHIIFNHNMTPIFSTVKFTCSRFNDGPETNPQTSSTLTYRGYNRQYQVFE